MVIQKQTLSDLRWECVLYCIQVCGEVNGWLSSPLTGEETAMIGIVIYGTNFCLGEDYTS
jgi:hypothetical protein